MGVINKILSSFGVGNQYCYNDQQLELKITINPSTSQANQMKKSNSNLKYPHLTVSESKTLQIQNKNKTMSTIVHTEHQHQIHQHTTKKNSLNKASSCAKMANSSYRASKNNLIKIQGNYRPSHSVKNTTNASAVEDSLAKKNQQLVHQNRVLRQQFCKLQESHIKDKAKIQQLISRMSQIKSSYNSTSKQTSQSNKNECGNKNCEQKRKLLELQLHRERIKVYELEQDKKKWDKSRQNLKNQYGQLLNQIQVLRDKN